jgi:hypothetical protein
MLAFAGCGGGGEPQDAGEQDETFVVDVTDAAFPARQSLAEETALTITVVNNDDRTIPNLAATIEADGEGTEVEAFGTLNDEPGLASRSRPVWVVDEGPRSGDTAYANTWAIGPLAPGRTATFRWRVAAVVPGRHRVSYRLAGSLSGKAKVELEDGDAAADVFTVDISRKPRQAKIDEDGRIVRVPGT